MKTRISSAFAAAMFVVALGLTACSSPAGDDGGSQPPPADSGYGAPSESEETAPGGEGSAALTTADSSLGEIVVDGEGMTVYMFDSDTQNAGASTCEGQCAENWPAVTVEGDAPELDGVTGEVGTITGVDGATQVTLNGWPLYYFAGDSAPGDVKGQGVNDVWWVLSPAGERMAE
ncbi:hypothetical protein [Microbacterium sp.]|uniref:COG4315 family predicted lipoprotein n=1 Tax=Microbacterium sp. TaxID=51671 RepID=UPI0028116BE6|nr:hypothetical protein [Microbacterium sp.]